MHSDSELSQSDSDLSMERNEDVGPQPNHSWGSIPQAHRRTYVALELEIPVYNFVNSLLLQGQQRAAQATKRARRARLYRQRFVPQAGSPNANEDPYENFACLKSAHHPPLATAAATVKDCASENPTESLASSVASGPALPQLANVPDQQAAMSASAAAKANAAGRDEAAAVLLSIDCVAAASAPPAPDNRRNVAEPALVGPAHHLGFPLQVSLEQRSENGLPYMLAAPASFNSPPRTPPFHLPRQPAATFPAAAAAAVTAIASPAVTSPTLGAVPQLQPQPQPGEPISEGLGTWGAISGEAGQPARYRPPHPTPQTELPPEHHLPWARGVQPGGQGGGGQGFLRRGDPRAGYHGREGPQPFQTKPRPQQQQQRYQQQQQEDQLQQQQQRYQDPHGAQHRTPLPQPRNGTQPQQAQQRAQQQYERQQHQQQQHQQRRQQHQQSMRNQDECQHVQQHYPPPGRRLPASPVSQHQQQQQQHHHHHQHHQHQHQHQQHHQQQQQHHHHHQHHQHPNPHHQHQHLCAVSPAPLTAAPEMTESYRQRMVPTTELLALMPSQSSQPSAAAPQQNQQERQLSEGLYDPRVRVQVHIHQAPAHMQAQVQAQQIHAHGRAQAQAQGQQSGPRQQGPQPSAWPQPSEPLFEQQQLLLQQHQLLQHQQLTLWQVQQPQQPREHPGTPKPPKTQEHGQRRNADTAHNPGRRNGSGVGTAGGENGDGGVREQGPPQAGPSSSGESRRGFRRVGRGAGGNGQRLKAPGRQDWQQQEQPQPWGSPGGVGAFPGALAAAGSTWSLGSPGPSPGGDGSGRCYQYGYGGSICYWYGAGAMASPNQAPGVRNQAAQPQGHTALPMSFQAMQPQTV